MGIELTIVVDDTFAVVMVTLIEGAVLVICSAFL